ncbi:MAG TPA: enolase C-terminal domain-like protein [Phycisphaerae bacterium]|nr:enolase C-terminal domain-like protein [Phycisphaerae bacterium]
MTAPLRIRQVQVSRLAIPLRFRFEHAAAARDTADPVVIRLAAEAPYAQHVGYGETLARRYVTGESAESVVEDVAEFFGPHLLEFRPTSFAEALEFIEALPSLNEGRVVNAARAAVELALIDLAGHVFHRRAADVAGWMGLPGFGAPGCLATARYSGVIVGRTRRKLTTLLRLQRWYGLRDFKIKVAVEGWQQRLAWAHQVLQRAIANGRVTLRADANGAWSLAELAAAAPMLEQSGVSALEQPLPESEDDQLPLLAERTGCDLIADESLVTLADGQRLLADGGIQVLNIRIAKNGGLMPALRMARMALAAGRDVQLGCLVGETSILTAAGIAFLEACPKVRFVEGAYGRFLLRGDVTRRPIRFHRAGRINPRPGFGLGIDVNEAALPRLSLQPPRTLQL